MPLSTVVPAPTPARTPAPTQGSAAFEAVLKVLGCVVLLTVANMLKKVAAKLLAAHFHRAAHFTKMQARA